MNPSFTIVVSRQCTADDIRILRRFQCCAIDGSAHEWEIEPQRHINGLTKAKFTEPVRRLILTTETFAKVFAFAEYGYLEESDVYMLGMGGQIYRLCWKRSWKGNRRHCS